MATDVVEATFASLVEKGNVLLDVWSPRCAPCIALMSAVEALEKKYGGRIVLLKLNAPENRKLCRDLRIAGLPAYATYRDGVEVDRVTGPHATLNHIEAAIERLLGGAPAKGLPCLNICSEEVAAPWIPEARRWWLSERDSVPGEAIAAVAAAAGAVVIEVRTECFV